MELLRKTAVFRIEQQTKDTSPEKVMSISLSDVPLLADRLVSFSSLTHLTLVSMKPRLPDLVSLTLSSFPQLRMLDVSDNAITACEVLPVCANLRRLFMANNKLSSWDELGRLAAAFPKLEVFDTTDNPVDDANRAGDVFALFPSLIILNARDRDGAEVAVADSEEGSSSLEESEESEDSFVSQDAENGKAEGNGTHAEDSETSNGAQNENDTDDEEEEEEEEESEEKDSERDAAPPSKKLRKN